MRLITIAVSHYCEKARWALEHHGIAYQEDAWLPIQHYAASLPLGGRKTVPILVDGAKVLGDSTEILQYLEAQGSAATRLYPADPDLSARVQALEDRFDLALGPAARRVAYFHLLPDRALTMQVAGAGVPPRRLALGKAMWPLAVQLIRQGLGINRDGAQRSLARIHTIFDEVVQTLGDREWLVGERFSAADLTFAALAAPLLMPTTYGVRDSPAMPPLDQLSPEFRALVQELRQHGAGRFALEVYRRQRRRVPG